MINLRSQKIESLWPPVLAQQLFHRRQLRRTATGHGALSWSECFHNRLVSSI